METLEEGLKLMTFGADVPTGTSPKDVVWTRNKTTLYRYRSPTRTHATPVLFVYALINRPYIFDLTPGNSFIAHLLDAGHDVFLLDWGRPGWEDRDQEWDEYVGEHLPKAAERVLRASGQDSYTLFGYCMGGTMAGIQAAREPDTVRNLITLTAPFDFSKAGLHGLWCDRRWFDAGRMAQAFGNVPGDVIDSGNRMLKPVTNTLGATMSMWDRLMSGKDMGGWKAMNKWVNDGVDFPGAAFTRWIEDFYQDNKLIRGTHTIRGEAVDLAAINMPLLNIAGEKDHIAPPEMVEPLNEAVSSTDVTYLLLPAGHVGLLVGSGAKTALWPKITEWLESRSD
jgi:polyhydroxyalkanoate synthase